MFKNKKRPSKYICILVCIYVYIYIPGTLRGLRTEDTTEGDQGYTVGRSRLAPNVLSYSPLIILLVIVRAGPSLSPLFLCPLKRVPHA